MNEMPNETHEITTDRAASLAAAVAGTHIAFERIKAALPASATEEMTLCDRLADATTTVLIQAVGVASAIDGLRAELPYDPEAAAEASF
jgi:hypothetical protein